MQENKIIKLDSLYGRKNVLEHWKENLWILKPEYNLTLRCGMTNDGNEFVDPEAGPMIVTGHKLPCLEDKEYMVKSIQFIKGTGYVIHLI